jgi:TolB-like protein/Tfp pilus assembly protein PilF
MAEAALTLFGGFELRLADGRPADLPGQKDRALLAILAINAGAAQPREKLAGLLWSDRGETQARDSLKHSLTRLRQCLAEVLPAAIVADRQSVRLDPTGLEIDVRRFQRRLAAGTLEALAEAIGLYRGEFLDGIGVRDRGFEDWVLGERQRLRRGAEEALTSLLAPALPAETRASAARRLLALDPLREAAVRALMQAHVEHGETAQALKLFETFRDRLREELGVMPEGETLRLYDAIRQRGGSLESRSQPAAPAPIAASMAAPERLEQAAHSPEPPLPGKPSIAVLPFENLSGDPEQEYFADGMVEEIITALSRMRWLFVIARNSSFTYRGRAVDAKQIGRELGVRYILEGSVRKAANRVRISGQLVDAATGAHLWADRFDGALEDVFDLQDRVAASVVGAISPKLEQAEIERSNRKPTENLDAYDHYLRGVACLHRWTREDNLRALAHLRRAIEADPEFASAYGMAARSYSQSKVSGWETDRQKAVKETTYLARKAGALGKDDPVALCTAGMALGYVVGDLENGDAMIERSLALNPNLAWAWLFRGWVKVWLGELDTALECYARAMRLSPQDPQHFNMSTGAAWAHFLAGRNEEARELAQAALREQPDYVNALKVMAASSALSGRDQDARDAMARLLALDPTVRISNILDFYPFSRPEDFARYVEGSRLAGMPE